MCTVATAWIDTIPGRLCVWGPAVNEEHVRGAASCVGGACSWKLDERLRTQRCICGEARTKPPDCSPSHERSLSYRSL